MSNLIATAEMNDSFFLLYMLAVNMVAVGIKFFILLGRWSILRV